MADDFVSDEEQYANESFENDSESEVPDVFDASSDNDNDDDNDDDNDEDNGNKNNEVQDPDLEPENNIYAYTRKQLRCPPSSLRNKDYVPYTSSSDDDTDVVISKTIAEINPQPMLMDITMTPKTPPTKSAMVMEEIKTFAKSPKTATREEHKKEVATETDESESETESESLSEQEVDITENLIKTENAIKTTITEDFSLSLRTNSSHHHKEQESSSHDVDNDNDDEDEINDVDDNDQQALSPKYCVEHHLLRSNESTHRDLVPDDYADENEEVFDTSATETEQPNDCEEPRIEFCISSRTPSNFNSEDYAFHMNFMQKTPSGNLKLKSGQRKSWSFSNERVREIDRQNQILLRKILTQKPTYSLNPKNSKTNMQNRSVTAFASNTRQTTAAVNRKKQQRQIDLDNQVLKRKIEAISSRRPNAKN